MLTSKGTTNMNFKMDPKLLVMEDVPEEALVASALPYDGFMFPFEKNVDSLGWLKWWKRNQHYGVYITIGYVILIIALKRFMKDRPPMNLQGPLFLWNFGLAILSTLGAWRGFIVYRYLINNHGVYYAVCGRLRYEFTDIWMLIGVLSKFVELGDTVFIVLRKKPLIFLHWFHHATMVLILSLFADENYTIGGVAGAVNLIVHSVMYTYYALQTLKMRIPKPISMFITTMQIMQFVLAFFIVKYVYHVKASAIPCCTTYKQLAASSFLGICYLCLFLKYFHDAYIVASMKRRQRLKEN